VEVIRSVRRLGFAAAVNRGLAAAGEAPEVAVVNDDAVPAPGWLDALRRALAASPVAAAVQGTVTDAAGRVVDGRGIALDRFGLPVQVDRGEPAAEEPAGPVRRLAVSATACLYRTAALRQAALPGGAVLDDRFGSYHEDLDLGLRLGRLGWESLWVPGAPCRHLGSATGAALTWRHPWWLLANRWRALAGNLRPAALLRALPRLLRGELRALRTLSRANPRALAVAPAVAALWPWLVGSGLARRSPGPRLTALPLEGP
jgi:GT2 family glycosyltransferase